MHLSLCLSRALSLSLCLLCRLYLSHVTVPPRVAHFRVYSVRLCPRAYDTHRGQSSRWQTRLNSSPAFLQITPQDYKVPKKKQSARFSKVVQMLGIK